MHHTVSLHGRSKLCSARSRLVLFLTAFVEKLRSSDWKFRKVRNVGTPMAFLARFESPRWSTWSLLYRLYRDDIRIAMILTG